MRYRFIVNGVVQGVGFRPTVYKIAKSLDLKGFVLNSSIGVVIEVEGENAHKFWDDFIKNLPPLARIESVKKEILPQKGYEEFLIKESTDGVKTTFISPDIAVCDDCLREMFDKNDRRYLYPFINCTNCGPRYTIIENIPYDRKNTSMKKFKMCEKCKEEYENPLDRRYHAQPVSCYECGPKLEFWLKENGEWKKVDYESENDKIKALSEKIKKGYIAAVKGLGGFHLVCDATNEDAVKKLRERKRRPYKPFAMMFKNLEEVKKYADATSKEIELINSKEKPIVLVKKKRELKYVAPDIDRYGVFLPYTPVHYLLFEHIDFPIVATSANISDEPIIRTFEELKKKLGSVIDCVLDYDREIVNACDDSVIQCVNNDIMIMRCARGYAPVMHEIKTDNSKKILAVGANQKNTISLVTNQNLILSPHIGDLGTLGSVEYFERTIKTFRRLYDFEEDTIVCDKHPYYESTKWAKKQNKRVFEIQHHYAHALSAMYEYDLDEECLAFVFDGTGYGDDGKIWGGEVFIADRHRYERISHFKYFKLIGAEKAVKNPANTAVALLREELAEKFDNYEIVKKLKNAPFIETSSVGRIFDMVAFLGGFINRNEYEGYSGLLIEKHYNPSVRDYLDFEVGKEIDFFEILNFAAENRGNFELIASVFLNSLANAIIKIAKRYDKKIILSGGVFQNKTLVELVCESLGDRVFVNKKIPLNDAGVSVGQAMWAAWNLD